MASVCNRTTNMKPTTTATLIAFSGLSEAMVSAKLASAFIEGGKVSSSAAMSTPSVMPLVCAMR